MMAARAVAIVLGLWTFVSAFLWRHTTTQFHNAWVSGALIVALATTALRGGAWARYVNAAMGGWLIVSTFIFPVVYQATGYNHLVVGTTLFVMALFPPREAARRGGGDARLRRRLW